VDSVSDGKIIPLDKYLINTTALLEAIPATYFIYGLEESEIQKLKKDIPSKKKPPYRIRI